MQPAPATRLLLLACAAALLAGCQSEAEQVQAARSYVGKQTVVLLSTRWCEYCAKLRADFKRWGVPYADYDVENNPAGHKAYESLDGHGIPITLVGQHRVDGYGPQEIHHLIVVTPHTTPTHQKTGD